MENLYRYSFYIRILEIIFICFFVLVYVKNKEIVDKHLKGVIERGVMLILFAGLCFDIFKGDFSSITNGNIAVTKSRNNFDRYNIVGWIQKPIYDLIYRHKPFNKNVINFKINQKKENILIVYDATKSVSINQTPKFLKLIETTKKSLLDDLKKNGLSINRKQINRIKYGDFLILNCLALIKNNSDFGKVSILLYYGNYKNKPRFQYINQDKFKADSTCNTLQLALDFLSNIPENSNWNSYYDDIINELNSNFKSHKNSISLIWAGDFEHENDTTISKLGKLCDSLAGKLKSVRIVELPSGKNELSEKCLNIFHNHLSKKHFANNYEKIKAKDIESSEDFLSKVVRKYAKNEYFEESNELIFYNDQQKPNDGEETSSFVTGEAIFKNSPSNLSLTLKSDNPSFGGEVKNDTNSKENSLNLNHTTSVELLRNKTLHFSFPKNIIGNDENQNYLDIYEYNKLWKIQIPIFFRNLLDEDDAGFKIFLFTFLYSLCFFMFTYEILEIYEELTINSQKIASVANLILFTLYILSLSQLLLLCPTYIWRIVICLIIILVAWFLANLFRN